MKDLEKLSKVLAINTTTLQIKLDILDVYLGYRKGARIICRLDSQVESIVKILLEMNIKVSVGTYLGLTGPTLETPAEYGYVRTIGADAVGMSTVPEIIVARHMEIPCFAISIITDLGVPGKIHKVSLADVIAVASRQEPKMTIIMSQLISRL